MSVKSKVVQCAHTGQCAGCRNLPVARTAAAGGAASSVAPRGYMKAPPPASAARRARSCAVLGRPATVHHVRRCRKYDARWRQSALHAHLRDACAPCTAAVFPWATYPLGDGNQRSPCWLPIPRLAATVLPQHVCTLPMGPAFAPFTKRDRRVLLKSAPAVLGRLGAAVLGRLVAPAPTPPAPSLLFAH